MKTAKKFFAASLFFCMIFATQVSAQNITVEVNGTAVNFSDTQPALIEGRTMVPLRGVFEQMGFSVDWDANTSTALMSREGTIITVTIGDNFITANNERFFPDVPPQIINSRFMIPLRAVTEATGDDVAWDAATSTARITTAFAPVSVTALPGTTTITNNVNMPVTVNANVPQDVRDEISAWITATASIINYGNSGNPRLFDLPPGGTCGCGAGFTIAECSVRSLQTSWSTNNANDLRRQIQSLSAGGHNMAFWEMYRDFEDTIAEFGLEAVLEVFGAEGGGDFTDYILFTMGLGERWEGRGIIAWDMYRIGTLVSWGHVAGYIDRDEALRLMEPAVNVLRLNFSNWEEATANYLDGFIWWGRGQNVEMAESRLFNFRNVIPGIIPEIYNDELFNSPPTANLQRTFFPTAQTIVGRFEMVTEGSIVYEFSADGSYSLTLSGIGELMQFTGTYRVLEQGSVLLINQFLDLEGVREVLHFEDTIYIFLSADGSQLLFMNPYDGQTDIFSRR